MDDQLSQVVSDTLSNTGELHCALLLFHFPPKTLTVVRQRSKAIADDRVFKRFGEIAEPLSLFMKRGEPFHVSLQKPLA